MYFAGACEQCTARGVQGRLNHSSLRSQLNFFHRFVEIPHRASRGVQCDGPAPDDNNLVPEVRPVSTIHIQEIFNRFHNTVFVVSRDVQLPPPRCSHSEENRFESFIA
jgi:hypothetical protein